MLIRQGKMQENGLQSGVLCESKMRFFAPKSHYDSLLL